MASLLTVPEVADILRCGYESARRLMSSGQIASAKVAGRWTSTAEAVDVYRDSLLISATPAQQQRRRRRRAS